MLRRLANAAPSWIVEAVLLFGTYLLFTANLQTQELYAGAMFAAVGATGTELVRAQGMAKFCPKPAWLLDSLSLPWYVLSGGWEILLVLAKWALQVDHPRSLQRAVRFDGGGSDAASAARRALAITYSTVPPNFIILDILRDRNLMLYHQVSPSRVPKVTQRLGAQP